MQVQSVVALYALLLTDHVWFYIAIYSYMKNCRSGGAELVRNDI